jgi:hypothetical protein
MDVYQAIDLGIRDTVRFFLIFQNDFATGMSAGDKISALLKCGGIIHYTRSGRSTVVKDEKFKLEEGDFLLVAEACSSGRVQVIPTTFVPTDYAFIMGQGAFYDVANEYMNRRPSTKVINPCASFESQLHTLKSGKEITTPIRNVLMVSHARGEGMLQFPLENGGTPPRTYLDQMSLFVDSTTRTTITDRVINNVADTNIFIRGCNIGKEPRYLRLIKTIFGGNVTVTAPKHYNTIGYFYHTGDGIDIKYEYMEYEFSIRTKQRITTKAALVKLFIDAHPTDIHGNPIQDARWNVWIPDNIRSPSVTVEYECTNPIHVGMASKITREYRYRHPQIYSFTIPYRKGAKVPKTETDRLADLRSQMILLPEFQPEYPAPRCPSPHYERWGYRSLDEMINGLAWTIVWNSKKGNMKFTGVRHDFMLAIPITDTSGRLMLNALATNGTKRYLYHDLEETDQRFFTRV